MKDVGLFIDFFDPVNKGQILRAHDIIVNSHLQEIHFAALQYVKRNSFRTISASIDDRESLIELSTKDAEKLKLQENYGRFTNIDDLIDKITQENDYNYYIILSKPFIFQFCTGKERFRQNFGMIQFACGETAITIDEKSNITKTIDTGEDRDDIATRFNIDKVCESAKDYIKQKHIYPQMFDQKE
jgi:hypothetical protein